MMANARFQQQASARDLDFKDSRRLDRTLVERLLSLGFLKHRENIITWKGARYAPKRVARYGRNSQGLRKRALLCRLTSIRASASLCLLPACLFR